MLLERMVLTSYRLDGWRMVSGMDGEMDLGLMDNAGVLE
jgi:hypothetical protein